MVIGKLFKRFLFFEKTYELGISLYSLNLSSSGGKISSVIEYKMTGIPILEAKSSIDFKRCKKILSLSLVTDIILKNGINPLKPIENFTSQLTKKKY